MSANIFNFPGQSPGRKPKPSPAQSRRARPTPDDETSIGRFREIVRQSSEHLILADGPVHPDADLLDLCAEALHLLKSAKEARAAASLFPGSAAYYGPEGVAWRESSARAHREADALVKQAKPLLSRARKLRAATAAGIYAKALLVRGSRTGAPELAKSLAEDLIACPGLRASLWPAQAEGGAA